MISIGYGPFPVTVTTRIIIFLVGNPYKPLFATVTGKGPYPRYPVSFQSDTRIPPDPGSQDPTRPSSQGQAGNSNQQQRRKGENHRAQGNSPLVVAP